jgi:hypothetical protein
MKQYIYLKLLMKIKLKHFQFKVLDHVFGIHLTSL